MTKITRLSTLCALLLCILTIPTNALDFSVSNINCTQLDWIATLTQAEWSVASYVELFFLSTQGSRNYTLLYSALNGGAFPTPGAYSKATLFGNTALSGGYRIGIGLADMNGNILTTTSTSMNTVQVTAIDDRSFTFGDCSRSAAAGVGIGAESSTASPAAASVSVASSAAPSSTLSAAATSFSTQTRASSTNAVSSTSTLATAAPLNTISTSTTSQPSNTAHSGVNKGAIAGAVIGTLVLLLLSIFFIRWCTSRRRTRHLSQAAHRMASLRPLSLCEKQGSTSKFDGSESLDSRHRVAKVHTSGDMLEVAALGRLSVGSRRRSEAATPSIGEELSLGHVLAEGTTEEEEIRVVKVPFHLSPLAPGHESQALDSASFSINPYLPLHRVSSTPNNRSLSTDNIIPPYPYSFPLPPTTEASSHSRSKSTPLTLNTHISTTPAIFPTLSTFAAKSPSASTFKIPRVSVPAYLTSEGANREQALGEAIERQISTSSSMNHGPKRYSTGGATFVSIDEDPFVDAAEVEHRDD